MFIENFIQHITSSSKKKGNTQEELVYRAARVDPGLSDPRVHADNIDAPSLYFQGKTSTICWMLDPDCPQLLALSLFSTLAGTIAHLVTGLARSPVPPLSPVLTRQAIQFYILYHPQTCSPLSTPLPFSRFSLFSCLCFSVSPSLSLLLHLLGGLLTVYNHPLLQPLEGSF